MAFIDDDVRLSSTYFEAVLGVFRERPDTVGVQGYIQPIERPKWREVLHRLFGLYHLEQGRCRVLPSISTTYPRKLSETISCEWMSGTNQVYRREVPRLIKWDERLTKYADGEDLDHSFRVHQRYPSQLCITPLAQVEHEESLAGRALGYELIAMREVYGWYLLHKLFPGSTQARLFYLWSRAGRLCLTLGAAVKGGRPEGWGDVWSLLRAYALVCRYARSFAIGNLEVFNTRLAK